MGARTRSSVGRQSVAVEVTRTRRALRRVLASGALVGLAMVAAACGSGGASAPVSTKAKSGTAHASVTVTVSSARVGTVGTVLVDQAGFTLYRFTLDGKDRTNCTGACAAVWSPLLVPAGGVLKAGDGVDATLLATIVRPGGARQVVFDGLPLYLYTSDKKAGQATGQAVDGTWFVVSASQPTASASTSSTTTTPPSTVPAGASGGTSGTNPPAISPSVAPPATSPTTIAPPPTSPPVTSPPSTSPPTTTTTAPPGGGGYGY